MTSIDDPTLAYRLAPAPAETPDVLLEPATALRCVMRDVAKLRSRRETDALLGLGSHASVSAFDEELAGMAWPRLREILSFFGMAFVFHAQGRTLTSPNLAHVVAYASIVAHGGLARAAAKLGVGRRTLDPRGRPAQMTPRVAAAAMASLGDWRPGLVFAATAGCRLTAAARYPSWIYPDLVRHALRDGAFRFGARAVAAEAWACEPVPPETQA